MAKKRKSTTTKSSERSEPADLDVRDSKKRIQDYRDVADSDDDFHDARDRVLLDEGPDAKRRRRWEDEEEFLEQSDEEVLGYSESEEEDVEEVPVKQRGSARKVGVKAIKQLDNEDDELDGGKVENDTDDDDDGRGWGTTRADLYGADAIETEEQALEEEAEALRLQKKQLQSMTAADYGFDEQEWQQADGPSTNDAPDSGTVTEILPQLVIPPDSSPEDRVRLLKARYPEFDPLSQELIRIKDIHTDLSEQDRTGKPILTTKYRAATAYLGALTTYFVLFTSTAWDGMSDVVAMPAQKLRDHAIMDSLVHLRALWQQVAELPDDMDYVSDDGIEQGFDDIATDSEGSESDGAVPIKAQPKLSRAERHAAMAQAASEAKRQSRIKKTEADLAGLDGLVADAARSRVSKKKRIENEEDSDLGDDAPMTAYEAAEKAKKKKSLRFYTSQIAQKASKRGASGRNAGGDEDIPYRERHKDRLARLTAEAEKRGRRDVGDDLGGDSDEDDARQAKRIRAEADEDDYYDMVAARTSKKKSDKAAYAEAQKQAALQGGRVIEEETVGADGKRKITYAIEKNKGLTPFRKKDVRNPRVKKRKKYDEKKKKLASIKPVFKGGEGRGGYGGELTGIKKGLVKSTKL